jgi:hypothetical protein
MEQSRPQGIPKTCPTRASGPFSLAYNGHTTYGRSSLLSETVAYMHINGPDHAWL